MRPGGCGLANSARTSSTRPACEHRLDPRVDPLAPARPRGQSSTNTRHSSAGRARSNCCCNSLIDWPVFVPDLQGPNHPPRVAGMQPAGRDADRPRPAARAAARLLRAGADFLQALPQLPIGRRAGKDAPQQRLQIQRRAADEQRHSAPRGNRRRRPARAASTYCATLYSSCGSTMSIR